MSTISKVLQEHGRKLVFDKKLAERISSFKRSWIGKGDHISFLAGSTVGEQSLVFSITDGNIFFQEVLEMDDFRLKRDIEKLSSINTSHKTASNIRNITLLWLMHMFYKSGKLKGKELEIIITDLYFIFAFIRLSSLHYRDFREFLAPPEKAAATYAALDYRFMLLRKGNWFKLLEYSAEDFLEKDRSHGRKKDGVNYDPIKRGKDSDILDSISRAAHKLNEYHGKIVKVYYDIIERGDGIKTSSIMEEYEDGAKVKDAMDNPGKYVTYLNEIISIKSDFISNNVVTVIMSYSTTIEEDHLRKTLKHMSDNYLNDPKLYREVIDLTIANAIDVLGKRDISNNLIIENLEVAIGRLRDKFNNSNIVEPEIIKVKKLLVDISKEAIGKRKERLFPPIATAVILYLFLRGIVGSKR
jgi:hypothetical protein